MTLRVEPFGGDPTEWDRFVRSAPGWTHFHRWGWKSLIERVTGHECHYLAARDTVGRLAGVLPLVRVQSRLFGHYLVSMPFLSNGGPLGSDGAVHSLVSHAVDLANCYGIELLELRSRIPLPVELAVSHRKITVVRDLPAAQPGSLWDSLTAKVRSQVRRPRKEGVTVRFGLDQVDPFFDVFSRHMRDLGTPTQPHHLFEAVAEAFPADVWFGCAYHRGQPIAAACGFQWGSEFEMTWASALGAYNRIAPNMLLYWAFMERAAGQGIALFNFGRCTPGSGTHRFKRQWESRDVALWWYQHSTGDRVATPSPSMAAYSWAPRVWRRLPLPLANLLGPRVVRLIP